MRRGLRRFALLLVDLSLIALATILALCLRDNLELSAERMADLMPYLAATLAVGAATSLVTGQHRTIWRFSVMTDYLRVLANVAAIVIGAVAVAFLVNRLEGVARALPLIQGLLMACLLVGVRVAMRVRQVTRSRRPAGGEPVVAGPHKTVLVVGVNTITDLFLCAAAEYAPPAFKVAGVLASNPKQRGRRLQQHRILGAPEDVADILRTLEVHGILIDRIVVTTPFAQLPTAAQDALLDIERTSSIGLDLFAERLYLPDAGGPRPPPAPHLPGPDPESEPVTFRMSELEPLARRGYWRRKRVFDLVVAGLFVVLTLPLLFLIALIVALDVGLPTVFWQERPGTRGRPFRLYKFRTMRAAHDHFGMRLADEARVSAIGRFLRRTRLDELPQVYNILWGEMSLVGPRPLLSKDNASVYGARLLVRPGLTGWAQVNGGREISGADKAALDVWYLRNATLWLDLTILMRTAAMMVTGDRTRRETVRAAWADLAGSNLIESGHATAATLAARHTPPDGPGGLPHAA
jgi:lipopolysaccharide/colanic/teichoic acid biosynthesis glycosyltransferase